MYNTDGLILGSIHEWFKKLLPSRISTETSQKKCVPEGLWVKCTGCNEVLYSTELSKHLMVCPSCNFHHRISARLRIAQFLDEGNQEEIAASLEPIDRLKFRDSKKYKDRISQAQKATGEKEALVVVKGTLQQQLLWSVLSNLILWVVLWELTLAKNLYEPLV